MIFSNSSGYPHAALQPRVNAVWALPISLAATFGISGGSLLFLISFPELLRWFSSLSVAFLPYFIQVQNVEITSNGLPHSAIQGSQDMCSFPWLIAAYHGLLRLVAPRHPPYTSIRLTILSFLLQSSHFTHHQAGSSWPEQGLNLTIQTKGRTIIPAWNLRRTGEILRIIENFSLLLMCAGFRFLPFRLLPSRTIKELSKLSRVLSNAFIFTFPSLIVSNITSVFLETHKAHSI